MCVKSRISKLFDLKKIDAHLNPDIVFNQSLVDSPIVTAINKERTCNSLIPSIAIYWSLNAKKGRLK